MKVLLRIALCLAMAFPLTTNAELTREQTIDLVQLLRIDLHVLADLRTLVKTMKFREKGTSPQHAKTYRKVIEYARNKLDGQTAYQYTFYALANALSPKDLESIRSCREDQEWHRKVLDGMIYRSTLAGSREHERATNQYELGIVEMDKEREALISTMYQDSGLLEAVREGMVQFGLFQHRAIARAFPNLKRIMEADARKVFENFVSEVQQQERPSFAVIPTYVETIDFSLQEIAQYAKCSNRKSSVRYMTAVAHGTAAYFRVLAEAELDALQDRGR
ncbi:hypothetical protein [Marinobacter salarius]|uniref:hypothetical protein n=1 Tax=Marinobacter salarius TaxID=1420917 RepID=UPI000F850AFD|nr:hypothetical protein [Marinobacter salarius]AZR43104.1 hypothetical protein MTMN5_03671 [Marinobacter salarius]